MIPRKTASIIRKRISRAEFLGTAKERLILLSLGFMMCYALIAVRTFDLAFIQAPLKGGEHQAAYTDFESLTDIDDSFGPTWRADIIDRNGVLLARSLKTSSLYADPAMITNAEETAAALHKVFPEISYDTAYKKLSRKGRFIWIKRHLPPREKLQVLKIGQPGLMFQDEYRRVYPQGALAAHIAGFSNIDGKGLMGIERSFDEQLNITQQPVQLTLDVRLQHLLRKETQKAINDFMAQGGAGVIVDIQSREILAAVSLPDFDPHYPGQAEQSHLFNRLTQGVYELGSTFKIFSTAAYLDTYPAHKNKKFDARKSLKRDGFTISDYHPEKRFLTIEETFIHSSNIGSALMGEEIGADQLRSVYEKMGLFSPMSLEIKELGTPLIPSPWRDINTLTASYGHGIAVTPLQMVNAAITVIGDGQFAPLTLQKHSAVKNAHESRAEYRVFSPETTATMRKLMRLVVTEGTGEKADIKGYEVGGKTGTAEKSSADGYDHKRLISSFLGMFPMSQPRYAVFIMVDEPKGTQESFGYATGGWVAAPAVGRVITGMTSILGIPPQDGTSRHGANTRHSHKNSAPHSDKQEARFVSY